jgi:hypothetical protein
MDWRSALETAIFRWFGFFRFFLVHQMLKMDRMHEFS